MTKKTTATVKMIMMKMMKMMWAMIITIASDPLVNNEVVNNGSRVSRSTMFSLQLMQETSAMTKDFRLK